MSCLHEKGHQRYTDSFPLIPTHLHILTIKTMKALTYMDQISVGTLASVETVQTHLHACIEAGNGACIAERVLKVQILNKPHDST
jgi:hypothetical protein